MSYSQSCAESALDSELHNAGLSAESEERRVSVDTGNTSEVLGEPGQHGPLPSFLTSFPGCTRNLREDTPASPQLPQKQKNTHYPMNSSMADQIPG